MRLVINSNDREVGTPTNFSVHFNFLPEDKNKRYKVYIKQAIISFGTGDPQGLLYLSSNSIIPINSEYDSRNKNTLCILRKDIDNDHYFYQNDGVENFICQGVPQRLNFSIHDANNDSTIASSNIQETVIILNLVDEDDI